MEKSNITDVSDCPIITSLPTNSGFDACLAKTTESGADIFNYAYVEGWCIIRKCDSYSDLRMTNAWGGGAAYIVYTRTYACDFQLN